MTRMCQAFAENAQDEEAWKTRAGRQAKHLASYKEVHNTWQSKPTSRQGALGGEAVVAFRLALVGVHGANGLQDVSGLVVFFFSFVCSSRCYKSGYVNTIYSPAVFSVAM